MEYNKKKYEKYKQGLEDASTVEGPSCIGCGTKYKSKVLKGYNEIIF